MINKVSYAVTAREEKDSKPHWDRLIEHNEKVKKMHDQKYLNKKLEEYQQETIGWTFTPR